MDKSEISKLLKAALDTYYQQPQTYNPILSGEYQENLDPTLNSSQEQQDDYGQLQNSNYQRPPQQPIENYQRPQVSQQPQQQAVQQPQNTNPQPPQPYGGPPINVVGNSSNNPINIVSKNYITKDSFEDIRDKEADDLDKNHNLAKIPDKLLKESATDWEPINYRGVDVSYDLGELSKAHIVYDEDEQKLIYHVLEPELSESERRNLEELKRGFVYIFEKLSPRVSTESQKDIVISGTKSICSRYGIKVTQEEFEKIVYYLVRDFLGLEIIQPLMHDPFIEDISCDGLGIPIFVNHLKYGPLEINRKYVEAEKLNSFIVKLAQKSNQEISLSKPILQGALPDGSRIEAIYGKEISGKGSSYTIRKFRAEPFTPIHLIEFGTMPPFLLAYLWLAVENKQSILVSGGTATGKTTILNALSLFVPPSAKIVSIEDTPEINLPHEHWLPMIARESEGKAQVSMFDLLKASLRERPEYIIVGEIRGSEASIMFQGMATGHAGLGTVHADKFSDLVNRMTLAPINLPKQLLTELNLTIFMKQVKIKNNMVRRVSSVVEIIDFDPKEDKFFINEFVKYHAASDEFEFQNSSAVISKLIEYRGGSEESLWKEIEKRRRILDLMHKKRILEFNDVSKVIKAYYKNPSGVFDYINEYEVS